MLKCFQRQTFKDFEIVLVDGLYEQRKNYVFPPDLKVKHVPHHPNHRLWLDLKYWAVCEAFNTGIIHSDGEQVIFMTDGIVFDAALLQNYHDWFQKGYFPLCGFRGIDHYNYPDFDIEVDWRGDLDSRLKWMVKHEVDTMLPAPREWFFGLSSVPLKAALEVNGYDERFDGCKGLEDMDMGIRLNMLYPAKFVLDRKMVIINLPVNMISHVKSGDFKHNYPLLILNSEQHRARVNCEKLSEADVKYVYDRTIYEGTVIAPSGPNPLHPESAMFKFWLDHQPIFNLEQERKERIEHE
jgi:hypothetical protein